MGHPAAVAPASEVARRPCWAGQPGAAPDEEGAVDVSMIARVLWLRRGLRGHERWSRAQLEAHQRREAATLRAFAAERSPFYRDFHRGLDRAPLGELPVVTKATVMGNFDQVSTDPAVRLADLQAYLDALHGRSAVPRQVLGGGDLGQLGAQEHHPGQR